jgi:hypothetical protein
MTDDFVDKQCVKQNKFSGSFLFELREKMITDNVCDGGVARYDMCIKGIEIIE